MIIKPTKTGRRIIAGSTPHGDYRIEINADVPGGDLLLIIDGKGRTVGEAVVTIRTPDEGPAVERAGCDSCGGQG